MYFGLSNGRYTRVHNTDPRGITHSIVTLCFLTFKPQNEGRSCTYRIKTTTLCHVGFYKRDFRFTFYTHCSIVDHNVVPLYNYVQWINKHKYWQLCPPHGPDPHVHCTLLPTCIVVEHCRYVLRRELVGGVTHQHTRLTHSPIPHHHTLNKFQVALIRHF